MSHSCDPGLGILVKAITKDLDMTQFAVTKPPRTLLLDDSATIFTNGIIITMAGGEISPVESLAI